MTPAPQPREDDMRDAFAMGAMIAALGRSWPESDSARTNMANECYAVAAAMLDARLRDRLLREVPE